MILAQQIRESCLSQKFVPKPRECCLSLSEYVLNYQNVLTIIEICITFYVLLMCQHTFSFINSPKVTVKKVPMH